MVATVYEIDFSCALNNCESKALIATGIIRNNTARKYLKGTWKKLYKLSLNINAIPNINTIFIVKSVTKVVRYFGKSSTI